MNIARELYPILCVKCENCQTTYWQLVDDDPYRKLSALKRHHLKIRDFIFVTKKLIN